jgi:hypothetical protein
MSKIAPLTAIGIAAVAPMLACSLLAIDSPTAAANQCYANPNGYGPLVQAVNEGSAAVAQMRIHVTACILYAQSQGGGYISGGECQTDASRLINDNHLRLAGARTQYAHYDNDSITCQNEADFVLDNDLWAAPPRAHARCWHLISRVTFQRTGGNLTYGDTRTTTDPGGTC